MSIAIERDTGLEISRRHFRSDRLVGLELEREIEVLANQMFRVPQRDLRLISVVDDDQLDVRGFGGALQARRALRRQTIRQSPALHSRGGTACGDGCRRSGDSD